MKIQLHEILTTAIDGADLHATAAALIPGQNVRYPINVLTDLHKIWYERSTIGGHPSHAIVIPKCRTPNLPQ